MVDGNRKCIEKLKVLCDEDVKFGAKEWTQQIVYVLFELDQRLSAMEKQLNPQPPEVSGTGRRGEA